MASYLQIPTFKASKDHFNKQDEDRFVKLVSDIELTQIHKKCGLVIVNPPNMVKNDARKFVKEHLKTKGLNITNLVRHKPSKISEFVYDTNTKAELDEDIKLKDTHSWESWKASNHSKGHLTSETFWKFFKNLAVDEKDVVYPAGINATIIDEGKFVR